MQGLVLGWPGVVAAVRGKSVEFQGKLELIWEAGQGNPRHGVIAGDHPDNPEWYWRWDLSPADVGVAVAPPWLLTAFARQIIEKSVNESRLNSQAALEAGKEANGEPQPWERLSLGEKGAVAGGEEDGAGVAYPPASTPGARHWHV